jgi:hypothetical protein
MQAAPCLCYFLGDYNQKYVQKYFNSPFPPVHVLPVRSSLSLMELKTFNWNNLGSLTFLVIYYSQNTIRTTKSRNMLYRNFYKQSYTFPYLFFLTWPTCVELISVPTSGSLFVLHDICDSFHLRQYTIINILLFPFLLRLLWLNVVMAWTATTLNLIIITSSTEFLSSMNVEVNYLLRMLSAKIYNIIHVSRVVLFVKQYNYATGAITMHKLQWNFSLHIREKLFCW